MKVVIEKPDIEVIKTFPSSLGRIDYLMVLCEQNLSKEIFDSDGYGIDGIWEGDSIADCITDDDFAVQVFVLHASANKRADPIVFIPELTDGDDFFSKNVTYYDSITTLHCIAAKHLGALIHFKTGFHYFSAGDLTRGPTSWETMDMIYQGNYKSISIDYEAFKEAYEPAKEIWLNVVRDLVH